MAHENRYSTGDLAEACGTTVRTVQYYDKKGLLSPLERSEGGRRLYAEEDADRLRFILMLKSFGLGLAQIKGVLDSPNREAILKTLLDEQASRIQLELEDRKQQLDAINLTRDDLERYGKVLTTTKSAMANRMNNEKARRRWWVKMVIIGILMDVAWIGTLILGILTGVWWPFPVALVFVVIAGCWTVRRYFYHSTYLCPVCGAEFLPKMRAYFFSGHTPRTRKLVCPCCGEKDWCIEHYHIEAVDLALGECIPGTCDHSSCSA